MIYNSEEYADNGRNSGDASDETWTEPARSRASRRPPVRSAWSVRGHVFDPVRNREVVVESELERGVALSLIVNSSVSDFQEQPDPISFTDASGKSRRHTPDFDVTLVDGSRRVYDVKPQVKVERSGIAEMQRMIAEQHPEYRGCLASLTEQHISRAAASNARWIIWGLRQASNAPVDQIRTATEQLRGETTIAALIDATKSGPLGFPAVLALIGEGHLALTENGRITRQSRIRLVGRRLDH